LQKGWADEYQAGLIAKSKKEGKEWGASLSPEGELIADKQGQEHLCHIPCPVRGDYIDVHTHPNCAAGFSGADYFAICDQRRLKASRVIDGMGNRYVLSRGKYFGLVGGRGLHQLHNMWDKHGERLSGIYWKLIHNSQSTSKARGEWTHAINQAMAKELGLIYRRYEA